MGPISSRMFRKVLAAFLLAFLSALGCTQSPRVPEDVLDTPAHHVSSGFKFLQKNYDADARREFELALRLDPHYSAAHRGLGLVYGKKRQFKSAFDAMREARDDAVGGEQKALAYVGFMRLYTMRQNGGWLEQVEERFEDALQWKNDLPQAYFYMGLAYKQANRMGNAAQSFKQVLTLNHGLVKEAREELATLPQS